ncbi:hypothetical protein AAE478_006949 [Parahypoxylon ruwenzoriense]
MAQSLSADKTDFVMSASEYAELEHRIEGLSLGIPGISLHGGGHLGIGGMIGDMANTYSSPADPIFWIHHGGIDRLWDTWQRRDWANRKEDIGGPDTQWGYPYDYYGHRPYKNVTLDFAMDFGEMVGTVKIRKAMDTQDAPLCYSYS